MIHYEIMCKTQWLNTYFFDKKKITKIPIQQQ